MMNSHVPKILAFSGSFRKGSYNKQLLHHAASLISPSEAAVTVVDLMDYPLPPYDGDLEAASGLPENAKKLKQLFIQHDALLIASPEYNSSVAGTMKNVIDWVSRPEEDDPYYLIAFKGKVAGLMSASPGELGGLRGLVHLRAILNNVGMWVVPEQVTLARAHEMFDEKGLIIDARTRKHVNDLVHDLVHCAALHKNAKVELKG